MLDIFINTINIIPNIRVTEKTLLKKVETKETGVRNGPHSEQGATNKIDQVYLFKQGALPQGLT